MKTLIITAPEELRAVLRDLGDRQLIATCAASRPDAKRAGEPVVAARLALRTLARRHQRLSEEIDELDELVTPLVTEIAPALLALNGVGADVAGQLLVTAGENPPRSSRTRRARPQRAAQMNFPTRHLRRRRLRAERAIGAHPACPARRTPPPTTGRWRTRPGSRPSAGAPTTAPTDLTATVTVSPTDPSESGHSG